MINKNFNEVCKIYLITNKVNNKKYVGQTWKSIHVRFNQHNSRNSCPKLFNAIKSYGRNNFTIEEIASTKCQECANYLEDYFINLYNSLSRDFGYNLKTGGYGGKHSEETKLKISKANTGKKNPISEATKKKLSIVRKGQAGTFRGKKHTDKTKLIISNKAKIRVAGEGNPMFGKEHSIETKAKIGKSSKIRNSGEGNPMFGKTGELSPLFGRRHSEETKNKMRETKKNKKLAKQMQESTINSNLDIKKERNNE